MDARTQKSELTRAAIVILGIPALAAAAILDRVMPSILIRRLGLANAYRVVARREGGRDDER